MTVRVVHSVTLLGVTGRIVAIEVDLSQGLPGMALVGLPDTAVSEARDRVRAAVLNSGLPWPGQRITVNLSPANLHKRGSGFDVALACGVLMASRRLPARAAEGTVMLGELGLDGTLRPVPGVVPAAMAAVDHGFTRLVVPAANARQAMLVPGLEVLGVTSLGHLCAVLAGRAEPVLPEVAGAPTAESVPDLAEVLGQPEARLALEVSAAGGHHLLLHGPPGAGKTMLATRLPGLLPDLADSEALEVTAVHSVAGTLRADDGLVRRPPFVAPHHTATAPAVVGGGAGVPRPGAASVAHRGVLFLDEAPEFRAGVLDALREPLESGVVHLARAGGAVRLPARFLLVLAANPCPCGRYGVPGEPCSCPPQQVRRYLGRLSGPLLDRVDLQLAVAPVRRADLLADAGHGESTPVVAARVAAARAAAAHRWADLGVQVNSEVSGPTLRAVLRPQAGLLAPIARELDAGRLTARGADRVLRTAWTLADLAGRTGPGRADVSAALRFRVASAAVAA